MAMISSIQGKFAVIVSLFLLFIILTVSTTLYIVHRKSADAAIISLAARQQVLIIKIQNESRAFITLLESESTTQEKRLELKKLIELFDTTLQALRQGGKTYKNNGQPIILSPSEDNTQKVLNQVHQQWQPVEQALNILLDPEVNVLTDQFYDATDALRDVWTPLFQASGQVVDSLETASAQKIVYLKIILLSTLIASFGVAFFSLYLSHQYIAKPARMMLNAAHQMNANSADLSQRLPTFGQDEIGQIAQAINFMRDNLQHFYENLEKNNKNHWRINQALNNATTSIVIANAQGYIIYCNLAAQQLFKKYEQDLQTIIPYFDAQAITHYHLTDIHPDFKRTDLMNELQEIYHTKLMTGRVYIEITLSPVFDDQGENLGWIKEFSDRSEAVKIEQEVKAVMNAVAKGDLTQRISLEGKNEFFQSLSEAINQTIIINYRFIQELSQLFAQMAEGELNQNLTYQYTGAFAHLQQDISKMIEKMIAVLQAIKEAVVTVDEEADQIFQGNTQLKQRMDKQTQSLTMTANNMERLTEGVQQNTDNTRQATHLIMRTRQQAESGGNIVKSAIEAMEEIKQSSQQMNHILSVIDEIAFQTNLLSLNAAVEAARAGEQGRGFAVVATEVRNLARRSASAAQDIKSLIADSVQRIKEGSQWVNESGKTLEQIVEAVVQVSEIIVEIAAASQEQSAGIEEMTQALDNVDKMTQQNVEFVAKAMHASETMQQQMTTLKRYMDFFQINSQ